MLTPCLSERERQVLLLGAAGLTHAAIAAQLGLSTSTVRQHASSLYRKINAGNLAHALTLALLTHQITIDQLSAATQPIAHAAGHAARM